MSLPAPDGTATDSSLGLFCSGGEAHAVNVAPPRVTFQASWAARLNLAGIGGAGASATVASQNGQRFSWEKRCRWHRGHGMREGLTPRRYTALRHVREARPRRTPHES